MDRNYSMGYIKEPLSYQQNNPYNDVYQDAKDRRFAALQNNYYHTNYRTDPAYKGETNTNFRPCYNNYNSGAFKEGQYYPSYYDQYKFNVNLPSTGSYTQVPQIKESYHFPEVKHVAALSEENNHLKHNIPKPVNTNFSQYMYTNCLASYATAANQNYCSYPQNCNDETRLLWDEYQSNKGIIPPYFPAQPPCNLNENYTTDLYRPNPFQCHGESLHSRDKQIYSMNAHTPTGENVYNSRAMWPLHLSYPAVPQNLLMGTYDRINYINDPQGYNCYPPKQESADNFYTNYGKHLPYSQNHLHTPVINNNLCNLQKNYKVNEQSHRNNYPTNNLKSNVEDNHYIHYAIGAKSGNILNNSNVPKIEPKYKDFPQTNEINPENNYYLTESKNILNRSQNLREFLSTWNEDEDDGTEKLDNYVENGQNFLNNDNIERNNLENDNSFLENNIQFKNSFPPPPPKIHVGITVDGNVSNNQYINLPDIIIDIEKSKDSETNNQQQNEIKNFADNLVVLESIDVPITDINKFTEILSQNSSLNTNEVVESFSETIPVVEILQNVINHKDDKILSVNNNIDEHLNIFDNVKNKIPKKIPKLNLRSRKQKSFRLKSIKRNRSKIIRIKRVTNLIGNAIMRKKLKKRMLSNKLKKQSPNSLKSLCVCLINTEEVRNIIKNKYKNIIDNNMILNKLKDESIENNNAIEINNNDVANITYVPKLSELCEYTITKLYENDFLIINFENNVNNNLYILQCNDENENVIHEITDDISQSNYTELLTETDDHNNNKNQMFYTTNEILKDISSFHHEEIVPDNYKSFKMKKLLQHLQSKYVQKKYFLKIFIIDKILKKYRKNFIRKQTAKNLNKNLKYLKSNMNIK